MSDQILIAKKELTVKAKDGQSACKMEGKGRLKGFVTMAICCTTPLLLVGAIALFGISLGAIASGFLRLAAILACPLGMYFMMRIMMKDKK